jgi:hypothetical protein
MSVHRENTFASTSSSALDEGKDVMVYQTSLLALLVIAMLLFVALFYIRVLCLTL